MKQAACQKYALTNGKPMTNFPFMLEGDPKAPGRGEQIGMAVAIAALSTLCAGLIGWGVAELRQKFGSKEPDKKP